MKYFCSCRSSSSYIISFFQATFLASFWALFNTFPLWTFSITLCWVWFCTSFFLFSRTFFLLHFAVPLSVLPAPFELHFYLLFELFLIFCPCEFLLQFTGQYKLDLLLPSRTFSLLHFAVIALGNSLFEQFFTCFFCLIKVFLYYSVFICFFRLFFELLLIFFFCKLLLKFMNQLELALLLSSRTFSQQHLAVPLTVLLPAPFEFFSSFFGATFLASFCTLFITFSLWTSSSIHCPIWACTSAFF